MYYVYIIYNPIADRYYIGSTEDPEIRLTQHNEGINVSTKFGAPHWKLVYTEKICKRIDALRRERMIKARKSRKYIELLIKQAAGKQ